MKISKAKCDYIIERIEELRKVTEIMKCKQNQQHLYLMIMMMFLFADRQYFQGLWKWNTRKQSQNELLV